MSNQLNQERFPELAQKILLHLLAWLLPIYSMEGWSRYLFSFMQTLIKIFHQMLSHDASKHNEQLKMREVKIAIMDSYTMNIVKKLFILRILEL